MLGLHPIAAVPIAGLPSSDIPLDLTAPTAIWGWAPGQMSIAGAITAPTSTWGWVPGQMSIAEAITAPTSTWGWQAPTPSWAWRLVPNRPRQEIHICVLTGWHVSLPDIELPISSWQARLRNGDPTYVSAIIPNTIAYAEAIVARTGGQIRIYKGYRFIDRTGGRFLALVVETNLASIRHDTGARSSSITLVGYANITNDAPKTMVYEALTYRALQADGRRRWRTGLKLNFSEIIAGDAWDFIARPGDTVTYNEESMVVGFISLAVSDKFELVELVEA